MASPEFEEPGKYPLGVLPEGLGGVGMGLGQGGAALTQVFRLHFSKPEMTYDTTCLVLVQREIDIQLNYLN